MSTGPKQQTDSRVSGLLASLDLIAKASAELLRPSSDVAGILPAILEVAKALIAADAYAVWRERPDGSWAILAAAGLSDEYCKAIISTATIPARELPRQALVIPDVFASTIVSSRQQLYLIEGIRALLVAPLSIDNETAGSVTFYFRSEHSVSEDEVHLATALANLTATALAMAEVRRQEERTRKLSEFVAKASAILASSLDYEATLKSVTKLAVPEVADWCAVDVVEGGELHRVAMAHVDPQKVELAHEFRRLYPPDPNSGVAVVVRDGKSMFYPHITDEQLLAHAKDEHHARMLRELGLRSVLVVPLTGREGTLGAITVVTSDRDLDNLDVKLAEDLAHRAAVAIENARLFRMVELSEQKFRTMADTVSCGIYISDGARLLYVNRAAEEMSGYTAEELSKLNMFDLVHPEHREMVMQRAVARFRGDPVPSRYEFKAIRKNGTVRWIDYCGSIIAYEGRRAFLATGFDITEHRLAQEQLERSEHEARTLLSNLPDVIARYGPDLRYLYMSPNVERITGIPANEFLGKRHHETGLPAELCEVFDNSLRKIFETGKPDQIDFQTIGSDGKQKYLIGFGVPLLDASGKVEQVLTITHDLTAFHEAEEAVARSEKELRLLTDTLPALVAYVDRDERFLRVNRSFEQWFQKPVSEFVGRTIREVMGPNYTHVEAHLRRALGGELVQYEATNDYADKRRHVLITYVPDFDADHQVRGFAALVQDISERRTAEDALRKTEKLAAVGRLAASISHEINNPLESVTNLIFLAKSDPKLPDETRGYLELAERELARVSEIATQTLRFHRQSSRPTQVNLTELIDSVLRLYEGRFNNSQVTIRREYREETHKVQALEGEIRQVIANLVGNAIDATPPGGVVALRVSRVPFGNNGDRKVRITIADSGHGISPELRARIFEPFFTTKTSTGTGLGLWVSREIIDKHRGSIRVRSSEKPGRSGTVFNVYLPEAFEGE